MLRRWLWLLAVPMTALAQKTTIVAVVGAARDSSPIADVEVMLIDSHRHALTNWMGEARLENVPSGVQRLRVRKLGFSPIDVQLVVAGDSMAPVFLLAPAAINLDTVRVLAPNVRNNLREFDSRRQLGIGHFLTQGQLDKEGSTEFALVASTRFIGVQAKTDDGGRYHLVSTRSGCGYSPSPDDTRPKGPTVASGGGASIRSRGGDGTQESVGASLGGSCTSAVCPIKMFLDGIILQPEDFDIVHTWDLAAVEYYSGANMPPQYRIPGSACGVMLLWSK